MENEEHVYKIIAYIYDTQKENNFHQLIVLCTHVKIIVDESLDVLFGSSLLVSICDQRY
jgi:hypothetical protein